MKNSNYNLFVHPVFISSILLLLVNDCYLKYAFHNGLTGKLSDFSGLFAFTLFSLIILPFNKKGVTLFCGIFFTWWKSSLSQPVINGINEYFPFHIVRVVDYSDLIALIVLPLAYKASLKKYTVVIPYRKICLNFVCILSLFAFCNTSLPRQVIYDYPENEVRFYENFTTTKTEEEILQMLSAKQLKYSKDSVHYYRVMQADFYYKSIDSARQWVQLPNKGDSAIYVRVQNSPYYIISSYTLDGDYLTNLEFKYVKGKKKNSVVVESFQTRSHNVSEFYTGKIKRKYKKHFKKLFE